jgi:hypothetical protein
MVRPIFRLSSTESGGMEVELSSQKLPDHPDNNKLERLVSGEEFSPLENSRSCTDILFLLLIICSWVAMTGLGLAAVGIVPSGYIKQGGENNISSTTAYY